jgi:chromosome partitioning protein
MRNSVSGALAGMTRVIAVVQLKGGVGKTTLAVNLANEACVLGDTVTLIDCDPQGSAMAWSEPRRLPFEVRQETFGSRAQIVWVRNVLKSLGSVLVLDTPAGLGANLDAVVLISDVIAIPCSPSSLDILSAVKTIEAVRRPNRLDPAARPAIVLVPTRVDASTIEGQQIVEQLAETGELVGPPLSYDTNFVRSFATGEALAAFAPGTKSHHEVVSAAAFLLQQRSKLATT